MNRYTKVILTLAIPLTILLSAGCSGNVSQVSVVQPSTGETTQPVSETVEPSTQEPSDITVETTTQAPTEIDKALVETAYLDYLQGHTDWFLPDNSTPANQMFAKLMQGKIIAFQDINGDGIEELVHYRPNFENKKGELNLCIVAYDNGIKTLYDKVELSIPGAEAGYSVFIGDGDKLYSITAKELNGHVIRFDASGSDFSAVTLADSEAQHLAKPEEAVCHIDGEEVTYQEFNSFRNTYENTAQTYLLLHHQNSRGIEDISMTYSEALARLGG